MPTVERYKGYRFFFFSNEGSEPVHIHVESGGNYAKFWLDPVNLVGSVGFNGAELTKLRRLITERQGKFKERWNDYFKR